MRRPWQHLSWMLMRHLARLKKKKKKTLAHWPRRHPLPPSPDPQPPPNPHPPLPHSQSGSGPPTGHFHLPSLHSGACRTQPSPPLSHSISPSPHIAIRLLYIGGVEDCSQSLFIHSHCTIIDNLLGYCPSSTCLAVEL